MQWAALWAILPLLVFVSGSETLKNDTPPTIIDLLSSQVQYSYFLRVLQRNGMIPIINSLKNITLIAPVNSAFAHTNNFDWENNELLRYIIDQPVNLTQINNKTALFHTLYRNGTYPLSFSNLQKDSMIDNSAIVVEKDIFSSHQYSFLQGIDSFLPIKPSMCDFLLSDDSDEFNGYSISIIKSLLRQLFKNNNLGTFRKKRKYDHHKKNRIFPQNCEELMYKSKTMLLPSDETFKNSLTDLQLQYYLSIEEDTNSDMTESAEYSIKSDILNILESLMIDKLVGGINGTNETYNSINNVTQYVVKSNSSGVEIEFNGVKAISKASNLVLSNGVFHLFNSSSFFTEMNIPTVDMTLERSLNALHFSSLVEELYFRKLNNMIDGSTSNQTILVNEEDRDDIPDDEVNINSFSSKQSLYYQFINGKIEIKEPMRKLFNTKLCSKKRLGDCFKIKFSTSLLHGQPSTIINDGIEVVGSTIETMNNTSIIILNKENPPPSSIKHSLVEVLSGDINKFYRYEHVEIDSNSCLIFFNFLNSFKLFSLPENGKGYSIFLPCGKAHLPNGEVSKSPWESSKLIFQHLQNNPHKFERVLKTFFIEGLIYSDYNNISTLETINKGKFIISHVKFDETTGNNLIQINNTQLSIPINSDILFNQGVAHITNKLILPNDVEISTTDLLNSVDNKPNHLSRFLQFLRKTSSISVDNSSNSFLVPSEESLKSLNVTDSYGRLEDFINFHLLNRTQGLKLLQMLEGDELNNITLQTNLSDTSFVAYKKKDTVYLKLDSIGTESNNHEVKVIAYGCSTFGGSCVFEIDQALNLAWLDKPPGKFLHVYLGMVSVGIGVVFGLIIFGIVMLGVAMCLKRTNKKQNELLSDIFTTNKPSYMSVRSSEDIEHQYYDYGYETDDDMLTSEHEHLLPTPRKKKNKPSKLQDGELNFDNNENYGATNLNNSTTTNSNKAAFQYTTPRPITGKTLTNTLNRERNFPIL